MLPCSRVVWPDDFADALAARPGRRMMLAFRSRSCCGRPPSRSLPSSTVCCPSAARWFRAMRRSSTTGRSPCSTRPGSRHSRRTEPKQFPDNRGTGRRSHGSPDRSSQFPSTRPASASRPIGTPWSRPGSAARRQTCNWEFDLRSEGVELLLPEIQNMRSLIRLVALKIRLAVADGKIDEAIDWLQTGYAMARHVSEGPILLQGLVGVSMAVAMTKPLEDIIQAPGVPSLFWALADRPRPFIDLTAAMDGERFLLEREIPPAPRARSARPGAWRRPGHSARAANQAIPAVRLCCSLATPARSSSGFQEWTSKLGLAALVAQAYPEAKAALIAQGRPACASGSDANRPGRGAPHVPVVSTAARRRSSSGRGIPYHDAYKGMNRVDDRPRTVRARRIPY